MGLLGCPPSRCEGRACQKCGAVASPIATKLSQFGPEADIEAKPEAGDLTQIRAAALTNFAQVAHFVGLDGDALLRSHGLDASIVADPERRMPAALVADLLEDAARQSGCAQFGLLMAESRSLDSIGPISLVLVHQARIGDVIDVMIRHNHLFGSAIDLSVQSLGDATLVRTELAGLVSRQGTELLLGYFCKCISAILDRHWSPESVHFTHSAPPDLKIHRRAFLCPIEFDSQFNGFVCSREAMLETNPASNAELADHAERLLGLLMPAADPSASERVRQSLRLLLPEEVGAIEQIARNLGMTPRSLQRALQREGESFAALLDDVRRELALRYLGSSHPIGMVANMIGYRRASSFTRWFNGQFGKSPAEWRRQPTLTARLR